MNAEKIPVQQWIKPQEICCLDKCHGSHIRTRISHLLWLYQCKSNLNCLFYLCCSLVRDMPILLVYFLENRKATEGKEQLKCWYNRSKFKQMHLVIYISYAYNGIQQYRMVKRKVAPPKWLLFVVTQIEKDQHTLI